MGTQRFFFLLLKQNISSTATKTTTKTNQNNKFMKHLSSSSSSSSSESLFLLGGDYAGLSATFDPMDGQYIPIHERLIPDELIQWGQEPKSLQVLISEDINIMTPAEKEKATNNNNDNKEKSDEIITTKKTIMERTTIAILPAIGCDLDNHETIKNKDIIKLNNNKNNKSLLFVCSSNNNNNNNNNSGDDVIGLQYTIKNNNNNNNNNHKTIRLESIFGTTTAMMDDDVDNNNNNNNKEGQYYRIRVILDIRILQIQSTEDSEIEETESTPSTISITPKSPMYVILEKKANEVSTKGTIADGGGLDSRTISQLLGSELSKSKTFVDVDVEDSKMMHDGKNASSSSSSSSGSCDDDGLVHFNFPGNIRVSYGPPPATSNKISDNSSSSKDYCYYWTCQVSHVVSSSGTKNGIRKGITRDFIVGSSSSEHYTNDINDDDDDDSILNNIKVHFWEAPAVIGT